MQAKQIVRNNAISLSLREAVQPCNSHKTEPCPKMVLFCAQTQMFFEILFGGNQAREGGVSVREAKKGRATEKVRLK